MTRYGISKMLLRAGPIAHPSGFLYRAAMNIRKVGWKWPALLLFVVLAGFVGWALSCGNKAVLQESIPEEEDSFFAVEDDTVAPGQESNPPMAAELAEHLGIEITALQLAVGGTRLNLRYRVLDSIRANQLVTNPLYRAYIIDSSGQRLARPFTPIAASLRAESGQSLRAGRTYAYFFPNPGQNIQAGDKVTLVIGDIQARDLVVQ
jgi:hypothetical protein